MIIENTVVFGFEAALRGMRNPMNSWDKSDSEFWAPRLSLPSPTIGSDILLGGVLPADYFVEEKYDRYKIPVFVPENPQLGPKDLDLASRLIRGGDEHGKFARQICVWTDWTLPRFVWAEVDTYKVGVVRDSCSTMHKLGSRHLNKDDFDGGEISSHALEELNSYIDGYKANKTVKALVTLKRALPEGFLQKSTMLFNYQVLRNMYRQRNKHRLPHWSGWEEFPEEYNESICDWILDLPYSSGLITAGIE